MTTTATKLTEKEITVLEAVKNNEIHFSIDLPAGTELQTVVIESGLTTKSVRGVVGSLIKKGFVEVEKDEEEEMIMLTKEARSYFGEEEEEEEEIEEDLNESEENETKPKSKRGVKGKKIEIFFEGEVHIFDTTYKASTYLSERLQCRYSTVDRYLVGKLKEREVNLPKKLIGTALEEMTCKYI